MKGRKFADDKDVIPPFLPQIPFNSIYLHLSFVILCIIAELCFCFTF